MERIPWTPTIEVESSYGTRQVDLATRHLMKRRIFLMGEITSQTANDFLSQYLFLEGESDDPITIYVNSTGGEVTAGLVIYDIIRTSKLKINMICTGMAASMAAILMAAGQEGRRYILPHSKMMIHEPRMLSGVGGSATSIKNISESILETRRITNEILAQHTGKSMEEIDEATAYDNYMNAEQAIEFGLCDKIVDTLSLIDSFIVEEGSYGR